VWWDWLVGWLKLRGVVHRLITSDTGKFTSGFSGLGGILMLSLLSDDRGNDMIIKFCFVLLCFSTLILLVPRLRRVVTTPACCRLVAGGTLKSAGRLKIAQRNFVSCHSNSVAQICGLI